MLLAVIWHKQKEYLFIFQQKEFTVHIEEQILPHTTIGLISWLPTWQCKTILIIT